MLINDWSSLCRGPLAWRDPLQLLWLGCGAPLLEEWVFRAGLHEALLRRGGIKARSTAAATLRAQAFAVIATALAFFLFHLGRGVGTAALVLPMALVIGLIYQRTGDWFICACAHAAANALAWFACLPLPQ
jgi:membrane protease YdiL (CAAX protease family)